MFRALLPYFAALAAWLAVFWRDLPVLVGEWEQPDYSHCFLVLPIVAYVVWSQRTRIVRSAGGSPVPGVLFCVTALLLFLLGRFGSLKFFIYLSMWLSLCGMGLLALGGNAWRALRFPFLVGLFAVPLPAFISRLASLRLRLISSMLSEKLLQLLGIPVYREGNIIDLGVIQLQVVDACSGLRYLWPSLLMALLIGWFYLRGPWRKVLLLVAAVPVTILANAFRIALTGVLTKFIDPSLAEGFFHDFSGWLVYLFALALLGGCARLIGGPRRTFDAEDREREKRAVARLTLAPRWSGVMALACLCAMLAGQMVFHHGQMVPVRRDFSSFPATVGEWTAQREVLSAPVLRSLGVDDYLNAEFRNRRTGDVAYVLVSWYDRQTTSHSAHAPTSCLVGGGWDVQSKRVLPPVAARDFPIMQMLLGRNGQVMISNFWFQQRGRVVVSEWANKWYLLRDAFAEQRTDGALIRVELPLRPGESVSAAQGLLDVFLEQLRTELLPFMPAGYAAQAERRS